MIINFTFNMDQFLWKLDFKNLTFAVLPSTNCSGLKNVLFLIYHMPLALTLNDLN